MDYEIFYGPFKLGEAKIYFEKNKIATVVYTTGIGNTFYPYYATWETWINERGQPKRVVIYSKEREKERKREIIFDENTSIIEYKKTSARRKTKRKNFC